MKVNRKWLAFFMAMLILLTSFPASIFAYSGELNFKIDNYDSIKNDGSTVKKGEGIRKEDTEADYTILFYTEKSDYDPSAPFKERYDYVGSKKISNGEVGKSPDLSKVTPDGIKFPDIDKAVTSNPTELAKYYHRNENLIKEKNAGEDGNQKLISSSGKTAFSIYYD
ncbi:MAG: hypothetical protein MR314_02700, partial [Ezakiella sp.]|nr:hypothetical protein [Ezakiella sp.]